MCCPVLTTFQMSTTYKSRLKRVRKMSKKQRLIMGLPSDSEGESDSSSSSVPEPKEGEDSKQEDKGSATANTSQVSLPAPTLLHSQSTASIVSNLSVSGGPAKADDSEDKLSKFDKHFKTATSTDEEVLSQLFVSFLFSFKSWLTCWQGARLQLGPLLSTSASKCPQLSLSRRAMLFTFTPALHTYSNPNDQRLSWLITYYSHPLITVSWVLSGMNYVLSKVPINPPQ